MENLTAEQEKAVHWPVDEHVRLRAVPGSGKTTAIKHRLHYLIEQGISPLNILVITFSRTQSEDMALRIFEAYPYMAGTALNDGLSGSSQITTIHAACRRILQSSFGSYYSVQNRAPEWRIKSVIEDFVEKRDWQWYDSREGAYRPVGWKSVLYWIDSAKRDSTKWTRDALTDYFLKQPVLAEYDRIYSLVDCALTYQRELGKYRQWTFADLPYDMEYKLQSDPDFQQEWHDRFTHIMVDEAQDTNAQAMRIVHLLEPQSVFVVGDQFQTLYRFNAATPEVNLGRGFEEMFGAGSLDLSLNFRSQPIILQRAHNLIQNNFEDGYFQELNGYHEKEGPDLVWRWYDSPESESEAVVSEVGDRIEHLDEKPGDFFIMSRTNAQLAHIELALLERKIPFVNLGQSSFFNRKVPRIVADYMRLVVDPLAWDAYRSVYNVASHKMTDRSGEYCATRYLGNTFNDKLDQTKPVIEQLKAHRLDVNERNWAQWQRGAEDLIYVIQSLQEFQPDHSAAALIEKLQEIVLRPWMAEEYPYEEDSSESAYDDLAVVLGIANQLTVEQFLDYIGALQATKDVKPEDLTDYVLIGTVYRFKGLERPVVYVIGLSDGIFPHRFSLGDAIPTDGVPLPRTSTEWDERNLCYVAITRAKQECQLSGIATWHTSRDPLNPSRFIHELGVLQSGEKTLK